MFVRPKIKGFPVLRKLFKATFWQRKSSFSSQLSPMFWQGKSKFFITFSPNFNKAGKAVDTLCDIRYLVCQISAIKFAGISPVCPFPKSLRISSKVNQSGCAQVPSGTRRRDQRKNHQTCPHQSDGKIACDQICRDRRKNSLVLAEAYFPLYSLN